MNLDMLTDKAKDSSRGNKFVVVKRPSWSTPSKHEAEVPTKILSTKPVTPNADLYFERASRLSNKVFRIKNK